MSAKLRPAILAALVLAIVTPVLAGCGTTSAPTVVPTAAATSAPTQTPVQATATTVAPTATPKGPTVGGTLKMVAIREPDTFDPHRSTAGEILQWLGASLVSLAPDGTYVPYLAQSWKVSDDGKTYEFALKKGIKFWDGSPCTAKDFVWTYKRALDIGSGAAVAGSTLSGVVGVEAPDDYTLRLTLEAPFYPFLFGMAESAYLQPLSQAAVEKGGDNYGRNPLGVGPYKLKEWKTGAEVILERNPDFNWGPSYQHQGPFYIQTLDFRILPEVATRMAGLETGEIGYSILQSKDVARVKGMSEFQILEGTRYGMWPIIVFNLKKVPLDDINVRKAINYALDRQAIINGAESGHATVQYGALSPTTMGYWSGIEQFGYKYDPAQAKTLLANSGYKVGGSGIMEKDGKPLKMTLQVVNLVEGWTKAAEVIKEQCKAVGIDLEIKLGDLGLAISESAAGNIDLLMFGVDYGEAIAMQWFFGTNSAYGSLANVNDSALDQAFSDMRTAVDPTKRQDAVNEAQKLLIQNAYMVPLYAAKEFYALDSRVKGAFFSEKTGLLYLADAYFETK